MKTKNFDNDFYKEMQDEELQQGLEEQIGMMKDISEIRNRLRITNFLLILMILSLAVAGYYLYTAPEFKSVKSFIDTRWTKLVLTACIVIVTSYVASRHPWAFLRQYLMSITSKTSQE